MDTRPPMPRLLIAGLVLAGAVIGGTAVELWRDGGAPAAAGAPSDAGAAEIDRLKSLTPSQSHAMADVSDHWANLWFAADKRNWPLAEFYFNETRSHIQWSINIRPIRKDADNRDVDLQAIFDAIDVSSFASVKFAIAQKDHDKFTAAYRLALDGCYACHKASSKPYLRPVIPSAPPQTVIDFAPESP